MDAFSIFRGIAGLVFLLALAFVFSNDRKQIKWRLVGVGILLQFIFAFIVLKTWIGQTVFGAISRGFVALLGFTSQGAQFVFGPLALGPEKIGTMGFFFVFQVLPTIIFFASLMAVLYHIGFMQRIVQGMAWVMTRLMGTSGAETLSVAANVFIGQTEAPLVVRPYIEKMTHSELFTMMVGGMATIAGGVMAAYIQMVGAAYASAKGWPVDSGQIKFAGHLLTASIMAAPATLVISKMLIPETGEPLTKGKVRLEAEKAYQNIIEAAAGGAGDGVKLAINVAGMLLAFISLIALLNYLLAFLGDVSGLNTWLANTIQIKQKLSLELIFGLVFQLIAFIIGVPWQDSFHIGSLMGIKLVLNEFVAYKALSDMIPMHIISDKAATIASYALCGFANFSSIAIQIGGISPLAESRRSDIASLGLKTVLGGTLATLMTATIGGILF